MNEREQLLKKLQTIDFTLFEIGLYLDSHPDNAEALKAFRDYSEERDRYKKEYEQSFGPLSAGSGGSGDYWDWVATPFPWEIC